MYKFLKSLFFRRPTEPKRVDEDFTFPNEVDPVMQECIMRAFKTGNIVIGKRQDDGSVDITEVKKD